jgi:rhodanese-related sulfurtransferase
MKTITVGQAVRLINTHRGAFLLAAMDGQEFGADHIPGSHRFDFSDEDQMERVLRELRAPMRARFILYSAGSGPEAYQAAEWLEEYGIGPVLVLAGGMQAWEDSGYALASDLGVDRLSVSQEETDRRIEAAEGGVLLESPRP